MGTNIWSMISENFALSLPTLDSELIVCCDEVMALCRFSRRGSPLAADNARSFILLISMRSWLGLRGDALSGDTEAH